MRIVPIDRRTVVVEGNETHRHALTIGAGPFIQWVLLHPTFNDTPFDPSTMKVLKFSEHFGFMGVRIVALYPFRTVVSNGISNTRKLFGSIESGTFELLPNVPVILAWGDKAETDLDVVGAALMRMKREGFSPRALRRTARGNPVQPTGISYPGPYGKLSDLQLYRPPLNIEQRMK